MKNYFTIKQNTEKGEGEKKIYEIDESETKDYFLIGRAIGISMDHCLELGASHKENFIRRVYAYRIIKDPEAEKISAAAKKETGKDVPYISVCFYEKLDDSRRIMFIPQRLEIEGRPELSNFPFNIAFMTRCKAEGNNITELSVIYLPDLATYQEDDKEQKMKYFNSLDQTRKYWLEIIYSKERNSYIGHKYCGEKSVGSAYGKEWNMFFAHLTLLGVSQDTNVLDD